MRITAEMMVVLALVVLGCGCSTAARQYKWQRLDLAPAQVDQPLLTGPPQTSGMRSGSVLLRSGEAMHKHSTNDNEELLVFLGGRARVVVGTEPVEVGVGQVLYIPPHTEHEVHNDATEDVRYIFTVAPVR